MRPPHPLCAPLAAALLLGAPSALRAEAVACPDLARAVQVATCPSEDELRYTFTGFCSDNARLYARDTDTCASYENYRKLKNVALWESEDGTFRGYVSCELPAGALQALKPDSMRATRLGKLTRLACTYGEAVVFTYRTKGQCTVAGSGDCAAATDTCRAQCD